MADIQTAAGILITTETGEFLYKRSANLNSIDRNNLGILQALLMASNDSNSMPMVFKTDNGFISYTIIEQNDSRINIAIYGSTSTISSEKCIEAASQLLYLVRNLIIFHIGANDIEDIKSNKRHLKTLDLTMDYILSNSEHPFILFNSINVTCHSIRNDRIKL